MAQPNDTAPVKPNIKPALKPQPNPEKAGLPPLADAPDMPIEFQDRPKLKMLWLSGRGLLDKKRQKLMEMALNTDNFSLGDKDWQALETMMPLRYSLTPTEEMVPEHVNHVMNGIKNTSIGFFGTLGGMMGAVGGPGGVIAGGAAGSTFGSQYIDTVEKGVLKITDKIFPKTRPFDAEHPVTVGQVDTPTYTSQEIAKRALAEGAIDGVTSTVGVFAPFLAKGLKQKMLGITPESMAMKAAGKNIGVDILPINVGGRIPSLYSAVIGRIPWVGAPIKAASLKQLQQTRNFIDTLPGRISSNNLSDPTMGVQLDIVAQRNFEKTMTVLSTKQQKLKTDARKLGAFIDTAEVEAAANKWLTTLNSRTMNKADPWVIKKLEQVVELSKNGKIDIDQWDDDLVAGIRNSLDKIGQVKGEGSAAFKELLQAAKTDLGGSGIHGQRQLRMDKEWEAGFSRYETAAAKKFELADKQVFKSGALGMARRNPDELVGLLMEGKSFKLVHDVRKIVDPATFNDLSNRYLDRNLQKSFTFDKANNKIFNPDEFARQMGLDDVKSGRFAVTKEMLRGTGVSVDMLQDLVKVSRNVAKTEIPDVSTFLARRVVMAGVASGAMTALAFVGPHGFLASVTMTLLARGGSAMISNPENVRLATLALDANADQAVRRSSMLRLYRIYLGDNGEPPQAAQMEQPMDTSQTNLP